jgi:hypothetical protein
LKETALKHKKNSTNSWKEILNPKPLLTEREARAMLRIIVKIRKESGYRDVTVI